MASRVLRELLVRLGVDTQAPMTKRQLKDFEDGLTRVKQTMRDGIEVAAQWSRGFVLAVGAVAAGVAGLTVDMGKQATEIERQARLLNMSTEEYQQWAYVAERSNASIMDLADTMLQINDITSRAIGGSKEAADTFALIGVNVQRLKGKNPGEVFEILADAVAVATDKGKALSAVSQILGEEAARQFGPAMVRGAAATRQLREEAVRLGVVMSGDQLTALSAVSTQWKRITGVTKGLRNTLAAALAPVVGRLLKSLADWIEANRQLLGQRLQTWVERAVHLLENLNRAVTVIGGWDVVLLQVATGAGMLLLLANLDKLKSLLFGLRVLWAGLGMAATAAASATGIAVAPLVLILLGMVTAIGLVALALEDLWVWWQGGNSLLKKNLDLIEQLIPAFGGFRELIWALVEGAIASVTNLGLLADAIKNGLAPALQLVDPLMEKLLEKLQKLWELWEKVNKFVGGELSGAAAWVRQGSEAGTGNAEHLASQLQTSLAGTVQGQVDRVLSTVNNTDNSQRSATFNMHNTFGAGGVRDMGEVAEGIFRRAFPMLQGGRR